MDKGIGLIRAVKLPWLDMTAAYCAEEDDASHVRARLRTSLGTEIAGVVALRKTADVLVGIWFKSATASPVLREEAVRLFREVLPGERLWLHYGLTLLFAPFFRECAALVGQAARRGEPVTASGLRQAIAVSRGQLGDLIRLTARALQTMRFWGVLGEASLRARYAARPGVLRTESTALQAWLLACALKAHPAEELPFADLLRLPELFPFQISVGVGALRDDARFQVQRMGQGWDSVRVVV